jgi:hypothetical protein
MSLFSQSTPPSDLTLVVAVIMFLVLVIAVTGYSLWQEEAVYRYEKEHRERMRRELNRKLRDDDIEEDYK